MLSAWFRAARARRGSIAVIVAVTAIPLTIALGMAIDYARLMTVRAELQRSIDSASIAGARRMIANPPIGPNGPDVVADARMYFWANYRHTVSGGSKIGFLDSTVPEPSVTPNFTLGTVRVDSTATVKLLFGGFYGYPTTDLTVTSTAAKVTRNLELVLALDNSNSMKALGRMTALKTGANALMDIVFGTVDNVYNDVCPTWDPVLMKNVPACREYKVLVGLVPFVASVNIRPSLATRQVSFKDGAGFTNRGGMTVVMPGDFGGFGGINPMTGQPYNPWKGCVEVIPGSGDDPAFSGGVVDPVVATANAAKTPIYASDLDIFGMPTGVFVPPSVMAYRWKPNPAHEYFRTAAPTGNRLTPNFWRVGPAPPATAERWYDTFYWFAFQAWHKSRGTGTGFTFTAGSAETVGPGGIGGTRESGPNRGCGYPILPIQTSKHFAKSSINELDFGAPTGTAIGLGFTWAWRLLSYEWQALWQSASTIYGATEWGAYWEAPYDWLTSKVPSGTLTPVGRPSNPTITSDVTKVVVLFTDGAGNEMGTCPAAPTFNVGTGMWESQTGDCFYYNAYGHWETNPLGLTPETVMNDQMVRVCRAMKAAGITIFTIVLQATPSAATELLMRGSKDVLGNFTDGCSSDVNPDFTQPAQYYVRAPDNNALVDAFKNVGAILTSLKLIQ